MCICACACVCFSPYTDTGSSVVARGRSICSDELQTLELGTIISRKKQQHAHHLLAKTSSSQSLELVSVVDTWIPGRIKVVDQLTSSQGDFLELGVAQSQGSQIRRGILWNIIRQLKEAES